MRPRVRAGILLLGVFTVATIGLRAQDAPPSLSAIKRSGALAAPDSTLSTADSLLSGAMDSLSAPPSVPAPWHPSWILAELPGALPETLLTRGELFSSSALLFSEALARGSSLGVHAAGCHGAWDLPHELGPGSDRLGLWFDGAPVTGAGIPEALCQAVSPLLVSQAVLLAPDACVDPLGTGMDGTIWAQEHVVPTTGAHSAFRLGEGAGGASTEELIVARGAGRWRASGSYADSRSEGRPPWVVPRYTDSRSQNLWLVFDHAGRVGALRIAGGERAGRWRMEGGRKLIWESQRLAAGWQPVAFGMRGQVRLWRQNELLRFWGDGAEGKRRAVTTGATVQTATSRGPVTWLLAAGVERIDLRFRWAERYAREWTPIGTGLATGLVWRGSATNLLASAGYGDPWWGRAHARGHLWVMRRAGARSSMVFEGWVGRSQSFTPRLEGDGQALIEEGILLPGFVAADETSGRPTRHAQLRLAVTDRRWRLSGGWFVRAISDALGTDPAAAAELAPAMRNASAGASRGDVTLNGLSLDARLELPLGAAVSGSAQVLLAPRERELPVLVAARRARGVLSLGRRVLRGYLHVEGRLVIVARGAWTTPYQRLPAQDWLDGEVHGTIGRTHFFLALRNLENESLASATYLAGEGMPLPFRSYQAGVEWHFLD